MKPIRYLSAAAFFMLVLLVSVTPGAGVPEAATPGGVVPVSADTPLVDDTIRQLMQDRNYPEALKAIAQAAAAPDAPKDYLAYLAGTALCLEKKYDEAVAAFDQLQKDFPQSPWCRRARFGKALALARKGDFRSAELIVRAEAEYLLSAQRKQEIADIYLEFADVYFKPPKDERKPDYAKAMEFYNKALEVGPKPDRAAEVELLVAQCQQQLGKLSEAAALYEKFLKDHVDSPLEIEARYRLGECRQAEGNLKDARRVWEDLLAKYVDSPSERIAEAQFKMAATWQIPTPPGNEELNLGTAALEAFLRRFPNHKLASQAHLQIASSYIHRGRYEDAVAALKRFLSDENYKDREEIPDARNLLGRSYQLQKKFTEALATWQEYLAKHPAHNQWSNVQREIINTEYLMAAEKIAAKEYDAANALFAEFLAKYPLDARDANVLLLMNRKYIHEKKWDEAIANWRRIVSKYPDTNESSLAQFSIADTLENKLGKLEEALEEYRKVTWGNSAGPAAQAIARLTAKSMTVATERVFRSDETPKLKLTSRNIEEVTVRAYKVDMETYFRKMHLAGNVESLDISLIDPDSTFTFKIPNYAKYQQLDSEIEVPLPDKLKVGVMAVTVSGKTLEATTMVVQSDLDVIVKSSRDEVFVFAENMLTGKPWGKVRLLISNGAKVFAEATTGDDGVLQQTYKELRDAGDVRVFAISDGHAASNVVGLEGVGIAQGLTSKGYIYTDRPAYRAGEIVHIRGCFRYVPKSADQIAVDAAATAAVPAAAAAPPTAPPAAPEAGAPVPAFAPAAGPVPPASGPESETAGAAPGAAASAAAADVYTIQKGKKYTLEVFDGRNRLVHQQEVDLGDFGTFHGHCLLPQTSPQGEYRVLARDDAGESYQGTFQVHEYQLEPVQLVIDSARTVFYRGEEIEGTIKAVYYYGAPLAGREVRYQLADDRSYTATTDEKGEVKFKLPTRQYSETQVLPLVVTLPERNLQAGRNFVLASQGFSIALSTVRPVYVAGETFEVSVHTSDAEGKPIGQKLTLKVLEQTTVNGTVGERLVEEHPIETVEKDGATRQTLKLDAGGRYVIRVEGTDRFKNPISGQHTLRISDDKDSVRLRILVDAHTYKVGDKAIVQLHWREKPALALITFQGARVLSYKLVALNSGLNSLEIPVTADLAPNFELAAAVMTDPRPAPGEAGAANPADEGKVPNDDPAEAGNDAAPPLRFHQASSPFTVERELLVKIETKRQGEAAPDGNPRPIRPGDEIEVTLTTTDPQGNPVAAELSLAMVEQSLLDRFVWPAGRIQDFFRGNARQAAVRTTSSVTFVYKPATQPINPRLLAEQDRIEITREEEESRRTALAAGRPAEPAAPAAPGPGPESSARPEGRESLEEAQVVMADTDGAAVGGRLSVAGGGGIVGNGPAQQAAGIASRARRGTAQSLLRSGTAQVQVQAGEQAGVQWFNGNQDYSNLTSDFSTSSLGIATNGTLAFAPKAENLHALAAGDIRQVVVLDNQGNMQQWNLHGGDAWSDQTAQQMATELTRSGSVLLPGLTQQETCYWNPSVVTGPDGKATVHFTLPERSTAWTLMAKGITTETLAGEGTDALTVKKELFGQLKLPAAVTDGDQIEILASVHNDAVESGKIDVTLKTVIAGRTVEEKKTLDVTAKGVHEVAFTMAIQRPEAPAAEAPATATNNAAFELTVAAGERKDVVRRAIPLLPKGMPVYATASGSATSDTTAWVEPPKDMAVQSPSLQILIGPTVERSLMDIVLGPAPGCQIEAGRLSTGLETATSDLMASLALQKLLNVSRNAAGPEAAALDGRVRSSVGLLVSAQNDDGGWSWTGRGGASQRYGSSQIVWALSLAKAAGYTVPDDSYNKALGYLRQEVAATANEDYESKAILLHALAAAGQGDFALANRLYRERPSLSPAALAHTALAFAAMDRKPTAQELLDLLGQQNLDDPVSRRAAAKGSLPWSHSPTELRALYALGLLEVAPKAPAAKDLVDWLMVHRTGHRFSPDKATGPAALALCKWFAESRFEDERYRLTVFVNDVQAKVLDIDPKTGTQSIDVPASLLKKDAKQRVNFQIAGRGRYTYQCILGGFVPADKLRSTTNDWFLRRNYEPAPLEVEGREIPRGFGVLTGSYSSFRNPLTQLPVGRRGLVDLEIWRQNVAVNTPEQHLEYLVVTEPIPSGATVIEKSVTGPFERFEISPGQITFYIGSRRDVGTIHYELYGYLPGRYDVAPTVMRSAYRADQMVVSEAKSLAVLPSGASSADAYRLTPQELYELGKLYFGKRDMKTAEKHLREAVDKWNLEANVYKHSVQMLLDAYLELGPPAQVVRHFEIIKEKWPAEEIPFDKIVRVGAAYHEMGEYERSYLVFRATVEGSFNRETGVAGFLESQGEFARSVDVMGRLLREYPPEGYIASATYALAQRVYAKAPDAAADEKLRKQKINRVELIRRAWSMLEGFLTAYPDDPAADQAAFASANALLELKAYQQAAAACNRYAQRYPQSDLLDSYWYMIGYCHFATGEHQAALEMCRKVADTMRVDKATGREVESHNKWRAIYILGQVYHSLGEPAKSIQEYRRVEDRFEDARQSIEYFTRKAIELPEVSMVKPGEKVEVELKFRNIASCDTKVYRIDLMKFSLLKRNLGGITQINLSGIRPYHEATIALGDGRDYRDRTHALPLPLKEEGAYLVVCRGDNLHASGLVLVTPLAVEVQEDPASGRVRTTVKDRGDDRYLSDVHVKVIGSDNADFISGETDLRGVFVADGVQGTSTVIAQAEGSRYAFFRGKTPLAVPVPEAQGQAVVATPAAKQPAQSQESLKKELLQGLLERNSSFQQQQVDQLKKVYDSKQGGVQAEKAF